MQTYLTKLSKFAYYKYFLLEKDFAVGNIQLLDWILTELIAKESLHRWIDFDDHLLVFIYFTHF